MKLQDVKGTELAKGVVYYGLGYYNEDYFIEHKEQASVPHRIITFGIYWPILFK